MQICQFTRPALAEAVSTIASRTARRFMSGVSSNEMGRPASKRRS
jgi:hypothetical protein